MNQYPQEYYTPAEYQAQQWQSIFAVISGVVILVAMGAWALSVVKKALKGEEVQFPL